MGGTSYSFSNSERTRSINRTSLNSVEQNFKQIKERKAHKEMKSQGIILREARDSDVHPNSFPIILALDLTGSMQDIPQQLIQTGLPKLISGIIQGGIQSPALLFLGVGDHETDTAPLQIGQFESGDEEMDMWLHRTYLEGNGGGNEGESYSLAHYFAARHCVTDHFQKRGKKGILITIGDEPSLKIYPARAMKEVMGNTQASSFTDVEILKEAQKQWEVFHVNPRPEPTAVGGWRDTDTYWKNLLGQNYLKVKTGYEEIPSIIEELVLRIGKSVATPTESKEDVSEESSMSDSKDEDIY